MEDMFNNVRRLFYFLIALIIGLLVVIGLLFSCSPVRDTKTSKQRFEKLFEEADKKFDKKYGIKEYHKNFNINNKNEKQ